jgi:hypothetical protein
MTVAFTRATPDRPRPDPAKHVNFTYGMVLGVDDFTQEFAYLSGRDRALARFGLGHGTVCGLRVTYDPADPEAGHAPRVVVSPGVAITPSGRTVCVGLAQCADLTAWLKANQAGLDELFGDAAPGAERTVTAAVVIAYAECFTDDVPVPGEPCRSAENLLAPSRVRDDFRLDLRLQGATATPPDRREEEAVRRFVAWLRRLRVADDATTDLAGFTGALLTAAGFDPLPAEGPTLAAFFPPDLPDPPPVPAPDARLFLRTALRIWVTWLLPAWRTGDPECGCAPAAPASTAPAVGDRDSVDLAQVLVRVRRADLAAGDVAYVVAPDEPANGGPARPAVTVVEEQEATPANGGPARDEVHRPVLVDVRLLQEWALTGPPERAPGPPPAGVVVAAGWFDHNGEVPPDPPFFATGGLVVTRRSDAGTPTNFYDLDFADYTPERRYVVTGTVVLDSGAATHALEVVTPAVPGDKPALRIRQATSAATTPNTVKGFQLQITRFGP